MVQHHERRQFRRISFPAPVEFGQGDFHALTEVIDISLRGILVRAEPLVFDRAMPVTITIRLSDDIRITMTAVWAHQKSDAIAFCWIQVDIESLIHLRRLLELNAGDKLLIERELALLGVDEGSTGGYG